MPARKKRPSADKTRKCILKAAQKLFASNGFNGTSISMIAKKASVNQSLIYHHFASKELLWREVKAQFLGTIFDEAMLYELDHVNNVRDYITKHAHTRYAFLLKHPDALRILIWQTLEDDQKQLTLLTSPIAKHLSNGVKRFQDAGQLRNDVSAELIHLMINQLIRGILSYPTFQQYSEKQKLGLLNQGILLLLDGIVLK